MRSIAAKSMSPSLIFYTSISGATHLGGLVVADERHLQELVNCHEKQDKVIQQVIGKDPGIVALQFDEFQ